MFWWKYTTFVLGMAQFQPYFSPTGASATDNHPIKKKQNNNNQSNSTIKSLGQRKRKLYDWNNAFWLVTSHVSRENPVKLQQWHVCMSVRKETSTVMCCILVDRFTLKGVTHWMNWIPVFQCKFQAFQSVSVDRIQCINVNLKSSFVAVSHWETFFLQRHKVSTLPWWSYAFDNASRIVE